MEVGGGDFESASPLPAHLSPPRPLPHSSVLSLRGWWQGKQVKLLSLPLSPVPVPAGLPE